MQNLLVAAEILSVDYYEKENRGYSDEQLHNFIEMYKLSKLPKAIFASVTNKSKEFKLKHLLKELKKEHKIINK